LKMLPAPSCKLTDIHGRSFSPHAAQDWLIIYAAASRSNFQALTKFIKKANATVQQQHPALRSIFVSVADLRVVPESCHRQVLPMLKMIDSKTSASAASVFRKRSPDTVYAQENFFIADWTGDTVKELFDDSATESFRVMIASGGGSGRVLAQFDKSTESIVAAYAQAIGVAVRENPAIAAPWLEIEPKMDASSTTLKIKPGSVATVEVEVDSAALLGWHLEAEGTTRTMEVCITRADPAGAELIMPRIKVDCTAAAPHRQICRAPAAGKYLVQMYNTMSVLKSKKVTLRVATMGSSLQVVPRS
jgi:hypothetical protein